MSGHSMSRRRNSMRQQAFSPIGAFGKAKLDKHRRDALQDLGSGAEDRHGQSVRNRICGKHPPQPSGTLQRGDQPAAQGTK